MRGRSRRLVTVAILGTVVAYVVAAGASPSVVRAAVMAGVVLLARESGRAGRAPTALGLAAAMLLLAEPTMIGDAGFRLSVMATAGLLAWANPLSRDLATGWRRPAARLARGGPRDLAGGPGGDAPRRPRDVRAPVARLAGRQPRRRPARARGDARRRRGDARGRRRRCSAHRRSVATLAGLPGWVVLHVIVSIVRVARPLPFAARDAATGLAPVARRSSPAPPSCSRRPSGVVVRVLWSNTGHAATAPRRSPARRRRVAGRPGTSDPSANASRSRSRPARRRHGAALSDAAARSTRITVLDVGQGDAILLETRTGARMLIDGGPDPDRILLALDERIPPWDRRLDVVVLTHPHEDHVAGLARVLARYSVGQGVRAGDARPGSRLDGSGTPSSTTARRTPALQTGARLRLGEVRLSGPVARSGRRPARATRHRHRASTTCRSCSSARPTAAGSC